VVSSRRGLLAAGAGLLLAGCGAEATPAPPPDAALLAAPLALELGLAAAYGRLGGDLGRRLEARAREHVARLRAAGAAAAEPVAPAEGDAAEAALALERRAMGAYVAAVGAVRTPARRLLAADLLTAAAQHAALLLRRLGRDPLVTAFPDGRAA
jgi:hypothetical protein